jgi:secreted trypsin-like serine protease
MILTRHTLLLLLICFGSIQHNSYFVVAAESSTTASNHLRTSTNSRNLIIGGHDAVPNRYPYYVALQTAENNTECGGTLIAPDVVLTAAHCAK